MDLNQLKAEHPDVYQAAIDEGKREGATASKETHVAEGQAAGILMERKRITDIEALGLPAEFEAKAKTEDWTAEKAAVEYLKVEAATRKEIATGMETDLKEGLQTDAPKMPEAAEKKEPKAVDGKSTEEEMKAAFEGSEELQAEFGGDFARYTAFLKAESAGKVKILNKGGK